MAFLRSRLAEQAGDTRATNVVLLGAYNAITGIFDAANLEKALAAAFQKPALLELNQRAVVAGAEFARSILETSQS